MYLGVPLVTGKLTVHSIEPLINKVCNKVAGWKHKLLLSQGGRQLILLKHLLTCISTHMLAVLDVLKVVFTKIKNYLLAAFFW